LQDGEGIWDKGRFNEHWGEGVWMQWSQREEEPEASTAPPEELLGRAAEKQDGAW
jgi:hypothetical protein